MHDLSCTVKAIACTTCAWFWLCMHFVPAWCVQSGMPKLPKIKSLLFLCNMLRKTWMPKVIFCMQVSMKMYYKLILWFRGRWSGISKVPKIASLQCLHDISKKKWEMKVIFHMQINMKVACKLISTLWAPKFPTRWSYRYWWVWWSILK